MLAESPRLPYPLTWEEQDRLFRRLPTHLARMALFAINTGLRHSNLCGLQWTREVTVPEIVFQYISGTSAARCLFIRAQQRSKIAQASSQNGAIQRLRRARWKGRSMSLINARSNSHLIGKRARRLLQGF